MSEELEFTSVGGAKKYFKYAECNEGDVLVNKGQFVGQGTDKFGNPNWDFREMDSDQIVCLNSAGSLNKTIRDHVEEGDICQVVYKGMTTIEKGAMAGKDCHTFDVFKAKSTKVTPKQESQVSLDDLE